MPLVDKKIQYAVRGTASSRHKTLNNLPGTVNFYPLIFKTPKPEEKIKANVASKKYIFLNSINKNVLQRASSFLLLKDSRASFTIEG